MLLIINKTMISKFKYINFPKNLQEIRAILPDIDYLPYRHKILPLDKNVQQQLQQILKSKYVISSALYFRLLSKSVGNIHIDKDMYNTSKAPNIALNLPILNGHVAMMYWYKQHSNTTIYNFLGPSKKTATPMLNSIDATCIATTLIDKPTIVKINDWHSISNISALEPCEILSIRFLGK